ncbi:MAG: M20/M25/M40 family metallo-hydrolase, partial [Armatimonadota bacterium]|nr:M20/M25/M40 family metallo-hydrolase [Armatimonadota bacterium]
MKELSVDRHYLVERAVELIEINSVNPSLVPDGAGEARAALAMAARMRDLGLEAALYEAPQGRFSVVGILRGSDGGRSLMWNGHLDTVGVEGMENPFRAEVSGGRIRGRGAYDMKGALAASLAALKALRDAGVSLRGDILLAAVADEEYASLGTEEVLRHHRPTAAVVTEATGMRVGLAHKGFVWLEVETVGRAAHGSRFDEGI